MVDHLAFDTLHSIDAASCSRLAAYLDEHRDPATFRRSVFMDWFVEERRLLRRRLGNPLLGLPAIPFRKNLGTPSIVFVIGNAALPDLRSGLIVHLGELICDA
jgi:hypothetical protein